MAGQRTGGNCLGVIVALVAVLSSGAGTVGQAETVSNEPQSQNEKIRRLEQQIQQLAREVQQLRKEQTTEDTLAAQQREVLEQMREDLDQVQQSPNLSPDSWANQFSLGGYGEMHANFGEGQTPDQFDFHRLVLYLGYDFQDWIKFHSETEIEHAFVSDGAGGELAVEQAYVDFLLSKPLNFRVGRILTPLGIINKTHEPPTFLGVERPSFDKSIIPTTWSSDGAGIFGALTDGLEYELYVTGGLDGSKFNGKDGIRNGRIKERPSLHEPALSGRIDVYPLVAHEVPFDQQLRLGLSGFVGGLDNGNEGKNPGIDGNLHMYSADFEYNLGDFDFRGVTAYGDIDGAGQIGNGTASAIFGWYGETGYHFWPDRWKTGKLKDSDAVAFVRYDQFDTQHQMPSGVPRNPAWDRQEWTVGVNFYLTSNLVLKADYQIRQSDADDDMDNLLNLGMGWQF